MSVKKGIERNEESYVHVLLKFSQPLTQWPIKIEIDGDDF